MTQFLARRLLMAIPTLLVISFIIFAVLDLAPGDPTGNLPMTLSQETRQAIRDSLGLDDPFVVKYAKWLRQFFVIEPAIMLKNATGIDLLNGAEPVRILSWTTRSPVFDLMWQRLPQTLWVVGLAYLFGVLIAVPVGVFSAYRQYSIFDQLGTFVSMVGFSVPTFFTGLLAIIIFSVQLQWLPSIYDTTLVVRDWPSFVKQVRQMIMPVTVLQRLRERYPKIGFYNCFGQSELGPLCTVLRPEEHHARPACGYPPFAHFQRGVHGAVQHDAEHGAAPSSRVLPGLVKQLEGRGTLLASDEHDFMIHRHMAEVADQWSFAEIPGIVESGREKLVLNQVASHSELAAGLSNPLRCLDVELSRPYFTFDHGKVTTQAYALEQELGLVHRLSSTLPGLRQHGVVVERY